MVMLMNGKQLYEFGIWETVKSMLPDMTEVYGAAEIAEWMEETCVLLVIDDFIIDKNNEELETSLIEWSTMELVVITITSDASDTSSLLSKYVPVLNCIYNGISFEDALYISSTRISKSEFPSFEDWIKKNLAIADEVIKYPMLLKALFQTWKTHKLTSVKTSTQLLWTITQEIFNFKCKDFFDKDIEFVLLELGKLIQKCLHNSEYILLDKFKQTLISVYPIEVVNDIISGFSHYSFIDNEKIILPHFLSLFTIAWTLIHQVLEGSSLKNLLNGLRDQDTIAIFCSGHLKRIIDRNDKKTEEKLHRCIKHIIAHLERAKDYLGYILCFINEALLDKQLINYVRNEICLPSYWEITNKAILASPISAALNISTPRKIMIGTDRGYHGGDIKDTVDLIATTNIPLALMLSSHLQWESSQSSDEFISIIQSSNVRLEDFIGCLNYDTVINLSNYEATKYLVCIRVRAKELNVAQALLLCPEKLSSLMWLEIDFDFDSKTLRQLTPVPVKTPLMDVIFKELSDEDTPFICKFLSEIRSNYSGFRVKQSSVTILGLIDILKQFKKRDMRIYADSQTITEYRKWRFPVLENVPQNTKLTDQVVHHMIGYNDNHHYSDNRITSSIITSKADTEKLSGFLKNMIDMPYFKYTCANYSITKKTDGIMETKKLYEK